MDCFLYDSDFRHEWFKGLKGIHKAVLNNAVTKRKKGCLINKLNNNKLITQWLVQELVTELFNP